MDIQGGIIDYLWTWSTGMNIEEFNIGEDRFKIFNLSVYDAYLIEIDLSPLFATALAQIPKMSDNNVFDAMAEIISNLHKLGREKVKEITNDLLKNISVSKGGQGQYIPVLSGGEIQVDLLTMNRLIAKAIEVNYKDFFSQIITLFGSLESRQAST